MSISEFDKRIIKQYRNAVIQKLGESEQINLSEAITKLIGFTKSKPNNLTEDFLDGFFYLDTHCINDDTSTDNWINLRNVAIGKLNILLAQNEISLNINSYITLQKSDRNTFRNNTMSIHNNNIQQLFDNREITCLGTKEQSCKIKWKIQVQENKKVGTDSGFLYMPSVCINNKLNSVFESIVQHSICSHTKINETNTFNIKLKGTNIGNESKCIYAIIIKVFSIHKPPWETKDNKLVCPPTTVYDASGLLPFCDYLILAPENNNYHVINLAAKYNNEEHRFLPIDALSTFVRFKSSKIMFMLKQGGIYFNNDTIDEKKLHLYVKIPIECYEQKPIIHIMVFNNYQKVSN